MKLCTNENIAHWYQYIDTSLIYNAWDTSCEAMNGEDFDGDTNMCTDNPILIERTLNSPTIVCMQRNAEKKIVEETDIITANKLAFNDDIGVVTNHVTSMFDARAAFEPNSIEYKTLSYRIQCGQNAQQACIDRAKGIIAKPMPAYWYSLRELSNGDENINTELNQKIVAPYKPYFMVYVYPNLKTKYSQYRKNNERKVRRKFTEYGISSIEELREVENKTQEMIDFLSHYDSDKKIGLNPCTVNRICWLFEKEFPSYSAINMKADDFDYRILKCGTQYAKDDYKAIKKLFQKYKYEFDAYMQYARTHSSNDDGYGITKVEFIERFKRLSSEICTNEQELCDIVLDLCYQSEGSKQFAWDVAGETIINNLLKRNDYKISFPEHGGDEFEYCGEKFTMKATRLGGGEDEDYFE